MEKRVRRVIEAPSGTGKLIKEQKDVADVLYQLEATREYIIIEGDSGIHEVEGQGEITGIFRIISGDLGFGPHDIYTLELEDGRKINILALPLDFQNKKYSIVVNDARNFSMKK